MIIDKSQIKAADKIWRLNLINSISGIKPANLVGTKSNDGFSNLAIISSVVHIGSNPALLGFIMRPTGDVERHTYDNIVENGFYTINHVHQSFIAKAHFTSAKFKREESEFEKCHLTESYINNFHAPFVKESRLKIGLCLEEFVPIKSNGTILIIGAVEFIDLDENLISKEAYIDYELLGSVGISGLNSYYALNKLSTQAYARLENLSSLEK